MKDWVEEARVRLGDWSLPCGEIRNDLKHALDIIQAADRLQVAIAMYLVGGHGYDDELAMSAKNYGYLRDLK